MKGPSNMESTLMNTNASSISGTRSGSAKDKDKGLGAMSKKMIKDSDKSSGTNNLVGSGSGNSTLTGKNPFAILKASAIAASQKAIFPNNFTNLPKVHPPFLPPL